MNNHYHGIIFSYIISNIADWIYKISLPILVFQITGSTVDTALSYLLIFLPFTVISLLSGFINEKIAKNKCLIISDSLSMLSLLGICGIIYFKLVVIWIYPLIFLTSLGSPIKHAIFQAAIATQVPEAKLVKTNSLIASIDNLLLLLSPLITGIIISLLGIAATLCINALLFLISVIIQYLCFQLCGSKQQTNNLQSSLFKQTLAFLKNETNITCAACLFFFSNLSIHLIHVNFTYIFIKQLELPSAYIGIIYAAIGIGALIGSHLAKKIISTYEFSQVICISTMLASLALVPSIYFSNFFTMTVCWGISSVFGVINMISFFTYRQKNTPENLLVSVVSLTRLLAFLSIPVAALLGGYLIESIGITWLLIISILIRFLAGFSFFLKLKHS